MVKIKLGPCSHLASKKTLYKFVQNGSSRSRVQTSRFLRRLWKYSANFRMVTLGSNFVGLQFFPHFQVFASPHYSLLEIIKTAILASSFLFSGSSKTYLEPLLSHVYDPGRYVAGNKNSELVTRKQHTCNTGGPRTKLRCFRYEVLSPSEQAAGSFGPSLPGTGWKQFISSI